MGVPFHKPELAAPPLDFIRGILPSELTPSLPGLLRDAPDPDGAVLLLERLLLESGDRIVPLFERCPRLLHYAVVIFGHSRFLGETLLQNTDLLHNLLEPGALDHSYSAEDFCGRLKAFRAQSGEGDLSTLLARFKRREYVRIMLRDVLRIAPLAETTAEISALSDVLIADVLEEAISRMQRRSTESSAPDVEGLSKFAVLSLGKLGGNELNYSSDVDLVFLYEEGGEGGAGRHESFVRLAQLVTSLLSRMTREGPVFRIDLRLRPRGRDGEMAVPLSQAVHYYSQVAEDWERQALIKVRHSAGDVSITRGLVREVQPHVYTEKINFSAIKTALVARERMHRHGRRRHLGQAGEPKAIDVKIDHGGIRDIEFLVQCLQRVYAGREPWLRSRGTLFALQKLHDKGHISGKEFHELSTAYMFLRHLEHRLQLRQGRQTHTLPSEKSEQGVIRRAMGRLDQAGRIDEDLVAVVQKRMSAVSEIYKRIIFQQQSIEKLETSEIGFALRGGVDTIASDLSEQEIVERLAADAPPLHTIVRATDRGTVQRKSLLRFLSTALSSSRRYAAVVQRPEAVERALDVFQGSEYLSEVLVRHPEEITTLLELESVPSRAGSGFLFEHQWTGGRHSDPVFAYAADSEVTYGERLALLRRHYRHRVFAEGVRDLMTARDVYSSLAAGTSAAEDAITSAFGIVRKPAGLAILALGRLGTCEFDIASDADLLFVSAANLDVEVLGRAVGRFVDVLSAYTQDGTVFAIDTRLRPRGSEGELLVSVPQLRSYFEREAQAWEGLLYTKLRFLAGDRKLGEQAMQSLAVLFARMGSDPGALPAIREMRRRLESTNEGEKNFKTARGGAYDIDFLTSHLLVRNAIPAKGGTLRERLWRCAEAGLLEKSMAARLDHAAELLRTAEHAARLVMGRSVKWLPGTEQAAKMTTDLVARMLDRKFPDGLENELDRTCQEVRSIYDQGMGKAD